MPTKAPSYCLEPRCPNTATSKGRCPAHARAKDQSRGTSTERGYDAAWANRSRSWRIKHPLCGERADGQLHADHSLCVREGRETAAQCCDHIVSMNNGGSKYDEANLQSLCTRCNVAKRNAIEGRGRP